MKFSELKSHLSKGDLSSAYLVAGEDAFLVQTALTRFRSTVSTFPEMNINVFFGGENFKEILDACESLPMLADKRLVIVNDFIGDGTRFEQYLKKPNPTTVLVFSTPSVKENLAKIISLLTIVDCAKLDSDALLQYIAHTAASFNCSFKMEAAKLLIEYCAFDLSRISKETEKLANYKSGGIVEVCDIIEGVVAETDYKIFELSEAVAAKNKIKAASVLKNLLDAKTPPVMLLSMLYSHFRRLLFCLINKSDPNLATLLSVKPYAVQKSMQGASRYTAMRLKRICDSLRVADYDFKSGKISDILALECCVFEILTDK